MWSEREWVETEDPVNEKVMSFSVAASEVFKSPKAGKMEDVMEASIEQSLTSKSSELQLPSKVLEEVEEARQFLQQQQALKQRRQKKKQKQKETFLNALKFVCLCFVLGVAITSSILVIKSCKFFSYQDKDTYETANEARKVLEDSFFVVTNPTNFDNNHRSERRKMNQNKNNIFVRNKELYEAESKPSQPQSVANTTSNEQGCCGNYYSSKYANNGDGNIAMGRMIGTPDVQQSGNETNNNNNANGELFQAESKPSQPQSVADTTSNYYSSKYANNGDENIAMGSMVGTPDVQQNDNETSNNNANGELFQAESKPSQLQSVANTTSNEQGCCGDYYSSKHANNGDGNIAMGSMIGTPDVRQNGSESNNNHGISEDDEIGAENNIFLRPSSSPILSRTMTPTIRTSILVSTPTFSSTPDPSSHPTLSPTVSPASSYTTPETLSPMSTPSSFSSRHNIIRGRESPKDEADAWVGESSEGLFQKIEHIQSHDDQEEATHNDTLGINGDVEDIEEPFLFSYYSPFEDLSEARVGLFSYSLGEQEDSNMCFRYYDESIDYTWFRSNVRDGSTDYWVVARYCSVFAPIACFMAVIQLVLESACCKSSKSINNNTASTDRGKTVFEKFRRISVTIWFLAAGLLQCGTFVVMFAPPVLSSSRNEEDGFCLSGSTIRCNMDTGAWLSLGSAIAYLSFAAYSTKFWAFSANNNENLKCADVFSADSSLSSISMNSKEKEFDDNTITAPSRNGSIRIPWHVREKLKQKKKNKPRGLFSLSSYRSGKRTKQENEEEKTAKNDLVKDGACCYCVFL